jgi:hypothetical protein
MRRSWCASRGRTRGLAARTTIVDLGNPVAFVCDYARHDHRLWERRGGSRRATCITRVRIRAADGIG